MVENHDVVRSPTRYGGGARGAARARAALLAVLGLPGAAYLYQGQELGLPEVDVAPQARQDPAWSRRGVPRRLPSPPAVAARRSGACGFSPVPARRPWLPVPAGWGGYSVETQEADPASMLQLCRAALAVRRRLHLERVVTADDPIAWIDGGDGRLAAQRGESFTLVLAMGDTPVRLPEGRLLLASGPVTNEGRLPPDTAAWLLR